MTIINKKSPSKGLSYQDYLDMEEVPVPDHLRITQSPDLGDMHLDPRRYFSREMHELEKEHVWTNTWQLACRVEDIPEAGDHTVYDAADISLIVVRNNDNSIKAFFNNCMHRGRRLVTEDGNSQKFRCPYHAWTWNIDGSNAFVPCKKDFEYAGEENFDLQEVAVEIWQGFVFVHPGQNPPPLSEYLEVLPEHFKDYDLQDCYKAIHVQKVVGSNWKVALEAFMESYHVIATHPQILEFMGDCNAQYDIFGDHTSRSVTANGVNSPHIEGKINEQQVMEATVKCSGRVGGDEEFSLPEGMTARKYLAQLNREQFAEAYDRDFSQVTDAELMDAILYYVFPNIEIWAGFLGNIVYVSRPHDDNPDQCIFDIMVLLRVPKGQPMPKGVPVHKLSIDQTFSDAEELGVLGGVFDQDMNNLPHMQQGLKTAARNGRKGLILGDYQESRIKHLHNTIDLYIEKGQK